MATGESIASIIPDMPPWILDHVAAMRNDQATVPVIRATMIPDTMDATRRPMSFFSVGPMGGVTRHPQLFESFEFSRWSGAPEPRTTAQFKRCGIASVQAADPSRREGSLQVHAARKLETPWMGTHSAHYP